jgi:hypothetical protein
LFPKVTKPQCIKLCLGDIRGNMKNTLIVAAIFLLSCEKTTILEPVAPVQPIGSNWVVYEIDSGQHNANTNPFRSFRADSLAFAFTFDSTAIYQTLIPANQESWNKLFGFADCSGHHHTNSVRLTWRYTAGVGIELAGYFYESTVRTWQIMDTIQPFDTLQALIYTTPTTYEMRVGSKSITSSRACTTEPRGYYLYPYFGGTEPAPQKMRVYVQHD